MSKLRTSAAVLAALFVTASSQALINFQLSPVAQTGTIGTPVSVQVFGFSTTGTDAFSGIDLYINWTNSVLGTVSFSNTGAPSYFQSGFLQSDPSNPDPNDSLSDGDAVYSALGPLGGTVPVSTTGTLLTTFRFTPVANGVATFSLVPSSGTRYPGTYVTQAVGPNNTPLTGTIGGPATITVGAVPEPSAILAFAAGAGVLLRRRRARR